MKGIIVGCDQNQEWLLPWWWKHYSKHNHYPVAFVDFGLSKEAKDWCKQRGLYIDLTSADTSTFVQKPNAEIQKKWEARYGDAIWAERLAWFKKPFACLSSPFALTLWLDLDCQVRGSLDPLFHSLGLGIEIALRRESESIQQLHQQLEFILPGEINYNSGVIAFSHSSSIIQQWTELAVQHNELFISDQQALSRAIFLHKPIILDLPNEFNWSVAEGYHEPATIHHFHGGLLKMEIVKSINKQAIPTSFDSTFH